MTETPSGLVLVCPECGAENQGSATYCWLCGGSLVEITPEVVDEQRPSPKISYTLMSIMAVITLVSIALGVADEAPGLAILVGLVAAPAVIVTSVRASKRRASGEQVTWPERIGTFLLSAMAVAAILFLLAMAAVTALFIWCVYAFSGFNVGR